MSANPSGAPRAGLDRGMAWLGLLALGLGLLICGAAAILLPAISNTATSTVLGVVLALAGVLTILHALRERAWMGFGWEMLVGAAETAGGILIVLNPMKGAAAVTLIVAIVLAAQGAAQLGLAFRVRSQPGWHWLAGASLLSIVVAVALITRFPFGLIEQPGPMAGLALASAGLAYIALAIGRRQTMVEAAQ